MYAIRSYYAFCGSVYAPCSGFLWRKYAIVAIWVIGALVTPQDPLSQILVAVPLMFLYEISILISKLVIKSYNFV